MSYLDLSDPVRKVFDTIDKKRGSYIEVLKEAVNIRSVKGDYAEAKKIISWTEKKFRDLDAGTTLQDVGSVMMDGRKITLPPVLIADFKSENSKMTLLVYGHLDVTPSPPGVESGDNESSFNLKEEDGALFGKGVTDSKGPLLCWMNAIQSYKESGMDLPLNIRFVIEAMKESGSVGLMDYLQESKGYLFRGVNFVCISDSSCLFADKPVITYGLRGCCKFKVTVEGAKCDLHSGVHGGMIAEPMTDLVYLLSNLSNIKGEILVPNLRDGIEDVTPDEEKNYHRLSFDVGKFKKESGVDRLLHKEDKKRLLMHRTRFPSLTIHSIDTGDSVGDEVIPCKVSGTFTIRIVPNQNPTEVFHRVQGYLVYLFNKVQSPNELTIDMPVGIPAWLAKNDDDNYKAASKAIFKVYRQKPELVREGSTIPIVYQLQQLSKKNVLLLPVGNSDHCILKNRDRIDVKTFMDGAKVVAAYIQELSTTKLKK
ncbi:cytosolic non-specific dipeptidase-like [Macrosteles quadrilineatus]|uniref:cytosolic non-specific dipeptidase-like n=1 Tax=Macrosteles quadrilineatus TaxID=74068 RepID=UPI0023E09A69|nr:cytosolic non-specific dipeptidase-like [Macrosteles quadrilineatus]